MITGLFETHVNVSSLEQSMDFYDSVLGLELGYLDEDRRIAFYWIGERGEAMLGLWEKPQDEIVHQHFAFRSTIDDVLEKSVQYLKDRSLNVRNFLQDGREIPMVLAWMPAVSIYFNDPDGHSLEFIAMLPEKPQPELGVVSYDEWQKSHTKKLQL